MGCQPVGEPGRCLAGGTSVSSLDDPLGNQLLEKALFYFAGEKTCSAKLNANQP